MPRKRLACRGLPVVDAKSVAVFSRSSGTKRSISDLSLGDERKQRESILGYVAELRPYKPNRTAEFLGVYISRLTFKNHRYSQKTIALGVFLHRGLNVDDFDTPEMLVKCGHHNLRDFQKVIIFILRLHHQASHPRCMNVVSAQHADKALQNS
jgi:hypothetical protein